MGCISEKYNITSKLYKFKILLEEIRIDLGSRLGNCFIQNEYLNARYNKIANFF